MAVFFDSVGAGGYAHSALDNALRTNHTHNASGGDIVVLAAVTFSVTNLWWGPFLIGTVNLSDLTRTVTYADRPMVSVGIIQWDTDKAWTEVFILPDAPTGDAEVVARVFGGVASNRYLRCETVSYTGATGMGTIVTANGTGTSPSASATAATNGRIVGVFGSRTGLSTTGSSVTQRYLSNDGIGLLMGDAVGTGASQALTVARSTSGSWGGILVPLLPADTIATCDALEVAPVIESTVHRLPRVGGLRRTVFTVPTE